MKRGLRAEVGRAVLATVCTFVLAGAPVLAQETAPSAPPAGRGARMEDRQMEMLTSKLTLTSDQQTQVKAILDDTQKQMEALRNDTSTSREEKRPKMMQIRKSSDDKIRATLTDDQKTKYDALQAEMRDRMRGRGQGMAPPPPPPQ